MKWNEWKMESGLLLYNYFNFILTFFFAHVQTNAIRRRIFSSNQI